MNKLTDNQLVTLNDQAKDLIQAEIRSLEQRTMLNRAAAVLVCECGYSIDEVSAASGLRPDEIGRAIAEPKPIELDQIAGIAC